MLRYTLTDTHCHLNLMVKKEFERLLTPEEIASAQTIINTAYTAGIERIINVGTSLIESKNSIALAQKYSHVYAAIGIHPNDLHPDWLDDFAEIKKLAHHKNEHKIVGIGETGLDTYRSPDNLPQQIESFKRHIELALEHQLAVVVHSRNVPDETLRVLEPYAHNLRAVIHCFSYDKAFAEQVVNWGFYLGIGATITYPKNEMLRDVVRSVPLESIVLETDAPFLPPQTMRGQQNHPKYIADIADYIAELRKQTIEEVVQQTTRNAATLFK